MKRLIKSFLLLALIVAQATKPYLFWAKEKRQLTEHRLADRVESQDDTIIQLTKHNQRINQHRRQAVFRDTTELMESNIMKIEASVKPSGEQQDSELGCLFSRLAETILFGEKHK